MIEYMRDMAYIKVYAKNSTASVPYLTARTVQALAAAPASLL